MKEEMDSEYYFIQLLFCKNRELLGKEFRELYDVLFERYDEIYQDGRSRNMDLRLINKKYLSTLSKKVK